ncbi:recombinase family protein [Sphingobium sp. HBC34]|uniref:Recombinase family protein n=1 Tax=Sphingobium cyanobacteriorum TaxID=3063954 RepID=A0ABT8ZT13_9SPHN|nr:recombinase family protein [Sphingobium sp. HBC34]MDO7837633.1 recombinase family protein [Sphingobium sp. HBC34]
MGYARVSTDEQDTAAQHDALRAQGCTLILGVTSRFVRQTTISRT